MRDSDRFILWGGALLVSLSVWVLGAGQDAKETSDQPVKIVRLDRRFDELVPANATVERIAGGFAWVEGPVWHRGGNYLLFSDIPNNAIFKWELCTGAQLFLQPSGYTGALPFSGREPGSNGLTFDRQGRLVLCEHGDRRIARLERDGQKVTLADRFDGKRLNSPNDLVYHSSGDLYFTDPPFGLPKAFDDPGRELPFCGVFRLSADGRLTLLTTDLKAPNGIAFSPDQTTLYVTDVDPRRPAWLAYDVRPDGTLGKGRVFFDATPFTRLWKGAPDGLKVDQAGNLFAAGPGGLYIFGPDGKHLGTFETGVPTANCAWGEDGSTLYIAASTAIYRVRVKTTGTGY
ncbi:MAG: SMP-30/gluconolactonase/LRE family protein [Acidobacteriota bacterium]